MKKILYILLLTSSFGFAQSQNLSRETQRISNIKHQLELLSVENSAFTENVKTEISVTNISLSNFLLAISNVHEVNINVSPELNNISIVNNFSKVTVAEVLVFICKEYRLDIDFTGSIISIKPYVEAQKPIEERIIPVSYNAKDNTISIDAKKDKLYDVFKQIMDASGKNLVFAQGLENELLTTYILNAPFDVAMYKLALANNLFTEKTKDNFWVFEDNVNIEASNTKDGTTGKRLLGKRNTNSSFKVLDYDQKLLEVDFTNKPIATIVKEISEELNIDIFTATPLEKAGKTTLKTKSITFDNLLVKIFESQQVASKKSDPKQTNSQNRNSNAQNTSKTERFNFKKEGNIYYFGTENQLSIRTVEVVHLLHRSVELLSDPMGGNNTNSTSNRVLNNLSGVNDNYSNPLGNGNSNSYGNGNSQNNNSRNQSVTNSRNNQGPRQTESNSLLSIFPEEIINDLDIKVDYELNSFYINGPAPAVERFKKFAKKIDKPVPVILIEVMIIEAKKSATLEAGVTWGIGDAPLTTQGGIFPETNLTLGAKTVNKLIGSFNGFGGFNLGKVGPNFFATIKAMEANGDLKIKSTPRLATLNSHRATFSNGQTSFYAVTRRNIYGTNNPQTSEITNYLPIDAELGLTIKPSVSGDGQVLLDISVVQSSFGSRVAEDAPPDVISRNFSSIIRMHDQDIAILGGLEEQIKSNSGSGVPFLAKIPLIKWLFSKRRRETSKSKLTILIKPTVIY